MQRRGKIRAPETGTGEQRVNRGDENDGPNVEAFFE